MESVRARWFRAHSSSRTRGRLPYAEIGDGVDESRYLSYSDGSFLRISIDSFVWEAAGLHIGVRNDSDVFGDDLLALVFSSSLADIDPLFPPATSFPGIPSGLPNSGFGISLFDSSQSLLTSQALPASVSEINLASTTVRNGSIFGNADGANAFYAINFNVDSVVMRDAATPVPEPGTLWLMAVALLALWLSMRRGLAGIQLGRRIVGARAYRHNRKNNGRAIPESNGCDDRGEPALQRLHDDRQRTDATFGSARAADHTERRGNRQRQDV